MRILNKKYWPGRVVLYRIQDERFNEMKRWLASQLPEKEDWTLVYGINDDQLDFYFREESDAMMFALKWSA